MLIPAEKDLPLSYHGGPAADQPGNLRVAKGQSVPNVFCTGCNELFTAVTAACPRCGMPSTRPDRAWMQDTLLLPHGDRSIGQFDTKVEVDNLLLDGQALHIYDCERLLGRGGMGAVYLARNRNLQRYCALKVLSPRRASRDIDYISRFENEGRAAAALVHPNIVTTHAIGRTDDLHYLEMEYVPGGSLQREIDRHGAIGPIRSTMMAVGIANGLSAAHRFGIVHRDLKPDNVMVTPGGIPKLADFGLAKQIRGEDIGGTQLAGTPHFMAPELFEGAPASTSTDVYALGVCYYLMLTGRLPFECESISGLMNAVLTGDCLSVRRHNPDIPLDIAECVSLLLSRDPAVRPLNGNVAAQYLQAVLGSLRDLDVLIFEAFHEIPNIEWQREDERFVVHLSLRDGRTQTVFIENSEHAAGDRLLLIYSVCCEADPAFYEEALRLNSQVHHGGIAIRDLDGRPCFVMVDTYPRGTVDGEEIRRSVLEVGARADHIEKRLTGRDVN